MVTNNPIKFEQDQTQSVPIVQYVQLQQSPITPEKFDESKW